jgi:hypothetical protein
MIFCTALETRYLQVVAIPMSNAFEAGVPSAKVVRLHNANHYVFRSNEADVLRAMNDFLSKPSQR